MSAMSDLYTCFTHVNGQGFTTTHHDKDRAARVAKDFEARGYVVQLIDEMKDDGTVYYESDGWMPPREAQQRIADDKPAPPYTPDDG